MPRKRVSLYNEVGETKTLYYDPLDAKPKAKARFPGGKFMLIGLDTYRVLRELPIPFGAHRVMYWLCEHNYYGNTVKDWTQAEIAKDCKVYRSRVSTMFSLLEKHHLILMRERGHCILNPYLWYRGETRNQQEACDQWDRLQSDRGQAAVPVAVAR